MKSCIEIARIYKFKDSNDGFIFKAFMQFLIIILLLVLFLSFPWSFYTDLCRNIFAAYGKTKSFMTFYCYSYYDIWLHHLESDIAFINLCQGRKKHFNYVYGILTHKFSFFFAFKIEVINVMKHYIWYYFNFRELLVLKTIPIQE